MDGREAVLSPLVCGKKLDIVTKLKAPIAIANALRGREIYGLTAKAFYSLHTTSFTTFTFCK